MICLDRPVSHVVVRVIYAAADIGTGKTQKELVLELKSNAGGVREAVDMIGVLESGIELQETKYVNFL